MNYEEDDSFVPLRKSPVSPGYMMTSVDVTGIDPELFSNSLNLDLPSAHQMINDSVSSIYSSQSVDIGAEEGDALEIVQGGEEGENWEMETILPSQPPPSPHISNDYVNFSIQNEVLEIPARENAEQHLKEDEDEYEYGYDDAKIDDIDNTQNDSQITASVEENNQDIQLDDDLLMSVMMDQYEDKLAMLKQEFDLKLQEEQTRLEAEYKTKIDARKAALQEKFRDRLDAVKQSIAVQLQGTEAMLQSRNDALREREAHLNTLELRLNHTERVQEKREQSLDCYMDQLSARELVQTKREEELLQRQQDAVNLDAEATDMRIAAAAKHKKANSQLQEQTLRVEQMQERLDRLRLCETLCGEREIALEAQDLALKKRQEEVKRQEDRVRALQQAINEQEKTLERRTARLETAWEDAKRTFSSRLQSIQTSSNSGNSNSSNNNNSNKR